VNRIIRVFPRRTKATPIDDMAYVGDPTMFAEADEVHISVAFSWDLREAERLAKAWEVVTKNIKLGGPALGVPGGEFKPGLYVQRGYVITSRGCLNRCPHCSVWKREGMTIKELPITDGWNVLDDNLLACSESHIRAVFDMLHRQKKEGHRVELTGGLEAARLENWHVKLLKDLKPKQMFFAYDTPDAYEPLKIAGKKLLINGIAKSSLRAYVLIGFGKDTFEQATSRLIATYRAGFLPMAMLYRDKKGVRDPEWARFQSSWARPASVSAMLRGVA